MKSLGTMEIPMASPPRFIHAMRISLLLIFFSTLPSYADAGDNVQCHTTYGGACHDQVESLKLKLIAIASILVSSILGICLPIFSRALPALRPGRSFFMLVKAFSSGVILATGYMHVLPDSFDCLSSECLPEHPWRTFPFTTFVAMLSAVFTLMLDSFSLSFYRRNLENLQLRKESSEDEKEENGHHSCVNSSGDEPGLTLLRYRVVAQVLELGIVVHSIVIGLAMGASENRCTIRPLIAALCFHQMFEGMGLGGCILQAEYGTKMKVIMVFFFSSTTPLGILLGMGLSKVYSDTSPTALIVVGLLNACSAGLLNYMALVDLLASDFMGSKLQKDIQLQAYAYVALLLGVGAMSLMAKWA